MLALIHETAEHYRIFSQAAQTIRSAVSDAHCKAMCDAYFDDTPTTDALDRLRRQVEPLSEQIFGAYIAFLHLACKAEQKSGYVPSKEISRMRSSWWRYYQLSKELDEQMRATA